MFSKIKLKQELYQPQNKEWMFTKIKLKLDLYLPQTIINKI